MGIEEEKKCQEDTLYWYNTYMRGENDPVLTQEEWDAKKAVWQLQRDGQFQEQVKSYRKIPLANGMVFNSCIPDYWTEKPKEP